MLMREVNPFPFLPATQAGMFISFDKKTPRADFHLSACMASMSLSGEENASRGCAVMIPRGMHVVRLPHCPCCLQRSAQTPLLLDPMPEMLPSRLSRGVLGSSCTAAARLHQANWRWSWLPTGRWTNVLISSVSERNTRSDIICPALISYPNHLVSQ